MIDTLIYSPDSHRLPPLPVECYHGNNYAEKVEGVREEEGQLITRLVVYLNLLADGEQRRGLRTHAHPSSGPYMLLDYCACYESGLTSHAWI